MTFYTVNSFACSFWHTQKKIAGEKEEEKEEENHRNRRKLTQEFNGASTVFRKFVLQII